MVFPVPALDHEFQLLRYKINGWFHTGDSGDGHKTPLKQAGAGRAADQTTAAAGLRAFTAARPPQRDAGSGAARPEGCAPAGCVIAMD